jgi:hypothetical protein
MDIVDAQVRIRVAESADRPALARGRARRRPADGTGLGFTGSRRSDRDHLGISLRGEAPRVFDDLSAVYECATMFTEHLPWLAGEDLEWVMGRGVCERLGWQLPRT